MRLVGGRETTMDKKFSVKVIAEQQMKVQSLRTTMSAINVELETLNAKMQDARMRQAKCAIEERIEDGILKRMEEINGEKSD